METTDFSVTGEPAVNTGMVGAADLSVTGKFLCKRLVDLLTLNLPQYPYQGRVKRGREG